MKNVTFGEVASEKKVGNYAALPGVVRAIATKSLVLSCPNFENYNHLAIEAL